MSTRQAAPPPDRLRGLEILPAICKSEQCRTPLAVPFAAPHTPLHYSA
uniref:Uncharacterized protein n=1 Tax=Tetraselmis sp. GSL018 TaxID=582737 RepID=A0A061S881_9CHLO